MEGEASATQAVALKHLEPKDGDALGDSVLHVAKLAPSIFLNEDGGGQVWMEIAVANKGRTPRILNSIMMSFENPVTGLAPASHLFREDEEHASEPHWSAMFHGFKLVSLPQRAFEYDLAIRGNKKPHSRRVRVTPVDFEVRPVGSVLNGVTTCMLHDFRDFCGQAVVLPPTDGAQCLDLVTLYLSWQERKLGRWLDEASLTFDYLVTGIRQRTSCIYMHVVLPDEAVLQSSTSVPTLKSFNPRRIRRMFRRWQKGFGVGTTQQRRILRADNEQESDGDYLYCSANYSFPRKRFHKQVAVFTTGIICGGCVSATIALFLTYSIQMAAGAKVRVTDLALSLCTTVIFIGMAVQVIRRILEHRAWTASDLVTVIFPSLRRFLDRRSDEHSEAEE